MNPAIIVLAILIGPACLIAGVLLQAHLEHRRKLCLPPLPSLPSRIEVVDEDAGPSGPEKHAGELARLKAMDLQTVQGLAIHRGVEIDSSWSFDQLCTAVAEARTRRELYRA